MVKKISRGWQGSKGGDFIPPPGFMVSDPMLNPLSAIVRPPNFFLFGQLYINKHITNAKLYKLKQIDQRKKSRVPQKLDNIKNGRTWELGHLPYNGFTKPHPPPTPMPPHGPTPCTFGKSTHISMISNSVTHLRSYANTAIARNSVPLSPETSHECRCCHAEHRCLRIERQYHRIEWLVFECFTMFHNVLRVFHDVLVCLTMFYDRHRRIGDCRLPQGSPITPQKLVMTPQGSSISPRKWSHAKLHPE